MTVVCPVMDGSLVTLTCVYASCDGRKRRELWTNLVNLNSKTPWLIAGDFNVGISQGDKKGGNPLNMNDVTDFNSMISQFGLIDGGFSSSRFTSSNNRTGKARIMQRLDRAFYNTAWLSAWSTNVKHLHKAYSNHAPVLINCFKLLTRNLASDF